MHTVGLLTAGRTFFNCGPNYILKSDIRLDREQRDGLFGYTNYEL